MKHTICPNCGANLDFGEICDCQREKKGEPKMEEKTITIPLSHYDELVKCSARIESAERLVNYVDYISATEICAVLGIEKKERDENVD